MADQTLPIAIVIVAALAVIIPLVLGYRSRSKSVASPVRPVPASTLVPTTSVAVQPFPEPAKVEAPSKQTEPVTEPKVEEVSVPAEPTPQPPEQTMMKPAEVTPTVSSSSQEQAPALEPSPEPEKPSAKRVRSTKPRKPRTTKAKKE